MSQIRGKNTRPEILVRKFLFSRGLRYRLYEKRLPGKPDIVLLKYKTIILIHGCFWHGHKNCQYYVIPETRTEWWIEKILQTKSRDKTNKKKLEDLGWHVIEIWECELRENPNEKLTKIVDLIKSIV